MISGKDMTKLKKMKNVTVFRLCIDINLKLYAELALIKGYFGDFIIDVNSNYYFMLSNSLKKYIYIFFDLLQFLNNSM